MVECRYKPGLAPATRTENWISGTPGLLVYTPYAAKRQLEIVGWLRLDDPDNRNEQGGWLIGRYLRSDSGQIMQCEVMEVLQAKTECRFPGYIEWSAFEEIRLQQEFFDKKEELARTDPKAAEELCVVGWWHTHPNDLPVFMSGTDMETQRLKYFKPEKYAVVINPQKGIVRAFSGRNATETAAILLLEPEKAEAEVKNTPGKTGKKGKGKKKRNKKGSKRKGKSGKRK